MKNVYLIGDCHLARVSEHFDKEESEINMVFWGKAAKSIYNIDFKKMYEENELSSGKEEQKFQNDGVIPFSEIKDDGILFSWLGYVDVRTFLTKYNDADAVAKKYIDDLVTNFPNSKIIIIEPLPQFTEMLLKYDGISPSYTYEDRLKQNKLFLESMHKYAELAGIKKFITQKEIYDAIDAKELTPEMTHNKAPHPVDGLDDIYNKKIFELFYKKAKEFLNE